MRSRSRGSESKAPKSKKQLIAYLTQAANQLAYVNVIHRGQPSRVTPLTFEEKRSVLRLLIRSKSVFGRRKKALGSGKKPSTFKLKSGRRPPPSEANVQNVSATQNTCFHPFGTKKQCVWPNWQQFRGRAKPRLRTPSPWTKKMTYLPGRGLPSMISTKAGTSSGSDYT